MLSIPCPFCGPRDETEYHYAGEPKARPDFQSDDATWGAYLFNKKNDKGPHEELWHHAGGCRRHLIVVRDTVTHQIVSVRVPGSQA